MTPEQANGLAIRYKNIWRGGPTVDELRTQLEPMDHATADQLLTDLARDLEHPPTIHQLWTRYRAARNGIPQGIPKPEHTGPPRSRTEVIDHLQWRVDTGAATPDDIAALAGLTGLHRHLEPPAEHPILQPTLDLDDPTP